MGVKTPIHEIKTCLLNLNRLQLCFCFTIKTPPGVGKKEWTIQANKKYESICNQQQNKMQGQRIN